MQWNVLKRNYHAWNVEILPHKWLVHLLFSVFFFYLILFSFYFAFLGVCCFIFCFFFRWFFASLALLFFSLSAVSFDLVWRAPTEKTHQRNTQEKKNHFSTWAQRQEHWWEAPTKHAFDTPISNLSFRFAMI